MLASLNNESTAANELYGLIKRAIENKDTPSSDSLGVKIERLLNECLQGTNGREIQILLVKLGISLSRRNMATALYSFVKAELQNAEREAFSITNFIGTKVNSSIALESLISDDKGLVRKFIRQFLEIRINIKHLGGGETADANEYWIPRINDYKYAIGEEIDNYCGWANTAVEKAAIKFSEAANTSMVRARWVLDEAENEQRVIIKANTDYNLLSLEEANVVKKEVISEIVEELYISSTQEEFVRKAHLISADTKHLVVFSDFYIGLTDSYKGISQPILDSLMSFRTKFNSKVEITKQNIKNDLNVLDISELPDYFDMSAYLGPLNSYSVQILAEIEQYFNHWREGTKNSLAKLNQSIIST